LQSHLCHPHLADGGGNETKMNCEPASSIVPTPMRVGRCVAIGEPFLSNHKSNSSAGTSARDSAIAVSIALQHGADLETIRRALCRDGHGRATGPLGAALDAIEALS
jgi:hypothetical protein